VVFVTVQFDMPHESLPLARLCSEFGLEYEQGMLGLLTAHARRLNEMYASPDDKGTVSVGCVFFVSYHFENLNQIAIAGAYARQWLDAAWGGCMGRIGL
jgi:hypothetical protein